MNKKRNQFLALCALVILIIAACEENPFFPNRYEPPNYEAPETQAQIPVVEIDATPAGPYLKGESVTITAAATVSDGGTLSYQWYSNEADSNLDGTAVDGATGKSYQPSTDIEGATETTYYYVQVTNTLSNGKTASAVSRTVEITVDDVGTDTPIRAVNVNVTAPAQDGLPVTGITTSDDGYTSTSVTWTPVPANNMFQGGVAYTVHVSLTADEGYTFIALGTAKINGQTATVTAKSETSVVINYTFPVTAIRTASNIILTTQPTWQMTYTHGDALDLDGLVVRLIFSDATTEDIPFASFASKDITTVPANGAVLSHTAHNGTHVVVSHVSGLTVNTTNTLTVNKAVISSVYVDVTSPMINATPSTTATLESGGTGYTCGTVSWNPAHNSFLSNTVYTATVTLTAANDYTFTGLTSPTINGNTAAVSNNTGTNVTLSYQFAATPASQVTGISITTQPSTMTYTHGGTLNLAGLAVQMTYSDSTTKNVAFADFAANNLSTTPANGEVLRRSTHNNQTVSVHYGTYTANANSLTVNQKTLTVTGVTHTKVYDGLTAANGVSGVTFSGNLSDETITYNTPTAVYTSANAGSATVNISALTLTGNSNTNYAVTLPATSISVAGGGITKKTLTVTGAAHTKVYDGGTSASVTSVTFNGAVTGETITYNTPTAVYTGTNAGTATVNISALTLTGASNTNYTVTLPANNIPVTGGGITKKALTVTGVAHTKVYDGGTSASFTTTGLTFSGAVSGQTITYSSATGTYTSANAGTKNMNITALTLTGASNTNYTVTLPANNLSNTGNGITKANSSVTWPTGLIALYGQTLTNVSLPGNGTSSPAGTFSWTTPSTSVGELGIRSHSMTFTPTNTTNYNTATSNVNIRVTLVDMVSVNGGTFQMGQSGDGNQASPLGNVTPVHTVTLSGFYMGKYEVTQELYRTVMTGNPLSLSVSPSNFSSSPTSGEVQSKRPVEQMTWYDAVYFCYRLSEMEGLEQVYTITNVYLGGSGSNRYITNMTVTADWTKNGYRLPTEAEWEYAAKGGQSARTPPYIWAGADFTGTLGSYAWYNTNANSRTHEVGKKQPNELDLYDMAGNVSEWCWEWQGNYTADAQTNPRGYPSTQTYKVTRGSSYSEEARYLISVFRLVQGALPDVRGISRGFRVVRNAQ